MHTAEKPFNPEGEKRFGNNVTIINHWDRHAQKQSGEVFAAGGKAISRSAISEKGQREAREHGRHITAQTHGAKGYVSTSERTGQTLEKMLEGYQEANPDAPVRKSLRVKEELSSDQPEDFLKLYDEKFGAEKKKLLDHRGLSKEDFKQLTPDEQEKIAEQAEEPVLREWLDDADGELSRLYPPRDAAAHFAKIFSRHTDVAQRLYNGSEVDLFHVTHKTITEPFLVSGALLRTSDGKRINSLEDLGGSFETLGGWESEVRTNPEGKLRVSVRIRGEEYQVDPAVLGELLKNTIDTAGNS